MGINVRRLQHLRKIFAIRRSLIPAAIIVFILTAILVIQGIPNEEKEVERIQEILAERYNANFVYEGKETKFINSNRVRTLNGAVTNIGNKDLTLYYFHPADNAKQRFYAIHGDGVTEMVFSVAEYCYDNFKEAIFENVYDGNEIIYTDMLKESVVDEIYGIQTELINAAKKYNIS